MRVPLARPFFLGPTTLKRLAAQAISNQHGWSELSPVNFLRGHDCHFPFVANGSSGDFIGREFGKIQSSCLPNNASLHEYQAK